jgi:DNA-binding transcriptional MerR regulator
MLKYHDTEAAAALLGMSPRTLERWRIDGYGPPFYKFGKRALYSESDLADWAGAQRHVSASGIENRK